MSHDLENHTVLVLGASGKTGRRVADLLAADGVSVRRSSRASDPPFDWTDSSGWRAVLQGATAMYVTYYPDLAAPGAEACLDELGRKTAEQGITRVVLLSGRGERAADEATAAFRRHVPTATVVLGAWFNQNFTEGMAAPAVESGRLRLPAPADRREPFVDADDIAACVVELLRKPTTGERLELTGPESLTMEEVAATLTRATGHEVRYQAVTVEEFAGDTHALGGLSQDEALGLAFSLAETLDGRNAAASNDIAAVLGRLPRTFADFARGAFTSNAGVHRSA